MKARVLSLSREGSLLLHSTPIKLKFLPMEKQTTKKAIVVNLIISLIILILFHVIVHYLYLKAPDGFSEVDISIISILMAGLFLIVGTPLNVALLSYTAMDPPSSNTLKFIFINCFIITITTFLFDAVYQLINSEVFIAYSKALFSMFGGESMNEASLKTFYKMPFFLKNIFSNLVGIFLFHFFSIHLYSYLKKSPVNEKV